MRPYVFFLPITHGSPFRSPELTIVSFRNFLKITSCSADRYLIGKRSNIYNMKFIDVLTRKSQPRVRNILSFSGKTLFKQFFSDSK